MSVWYLGSRGFPVDSLEKYFSTFVELNLTFNESYFNSLEMYNGFVKFNYISKLVEVIEIAFHFI